MTSLPGTPQGADLSSVLAADLGRVRSKVSLFVHEADGRWVSHGTASAFSTAHSPREGVAGGLMTAAGELQRASGRRLLSGEGRNATLRLDESGAQAFVACGSAADPLAVLVLAASHHSSQWAFEAAEWTYARIAGQASLTPAPGSPHVRRWADDLHPHGASDVVDDIRQLSPDAILLTGGYDDGATAALLDMARLLVSARPPNRPPLTVLVAGNTRVAPAVALLLEGRADVRILPNLLPFAGQPQVQPIAGALDDLYSQRKLSTLSGFGPVGSASAGPVPSTARALSTAWLLLARLKNAPVLGLDIGGSSSLAGIAAADGAHRLRVRTDMGVNTGWLDVAAEVDVRAIARWLPFALGRNDLQQRLAERQDMTFAVPQSDAALLFQEALTREAWRQLLHPAAGRPLAPGEPSAQPLHIVGSGGAIAHAPNRWRSALMLLDTVEPLGIIRLWLDRAGALPQVGAVAAINPDIAESLLGGPILSDLGVAICFAGSTATGNKAADVQMHMPDGSVRRTVVAWRSIHHLPTGGLAGITVSIKPVRGVYVPGFEGKQSIDLELTGGETGVILDCRPRPLSTILDADASHTRMHAWLAAGAE